MQTINITNQNFDFDSYCNQYRGLIESKLDEYLTAQLPVKLWESMRYSVLSGGKRLRALLCLASAQAVMKDSSRGGLENSSAEWHNSHAIAAAVPSFLEPYLPCCCALEMVHAMSLIHDDLPSMDNDDYRRGKPTNHKVYGEAMALLSGDALLMLAVEILIRYTPKNIDSNILLEVATRLCQATGASGMVGGQVLDLAFTGHQNQIGNSDNFVSQAEAVEAIHSRKTGALIKFAVWSGAKLALANESQLKILDQFAQRLGLAFQIADDILDSTGDLNTLGKTPGKDEAANKATWVTVFGPAKAAEKLKMLEEEGLAILSSLTNDGTKIRPLAELLRYTINRQK